MINFPITNQNALTQSFTTTNNVLQQRLQIAIGTVLGSASFIKQYGSRIHLSRGKQSNSEINLLVQSEVQRIIDEIGNLTITPNEINPKLGVYINTTENERINIQIVAQVIATFSEVKITYQI